MTDRSGLKLTDGSDPGDSTKTERLITSTVNGRPVFKVMAELPMALTLKNTLVLRNGRNNLYFKCKRNFNVSRKISRLNGVKDFKTCCSSSNSGSRHTKIEENQLVTSRRNLVISSSGIAVTSILSGLPTYAAVTETQQVPALGQITIPPLPSGSSVELSILDKCGLGVSVYPDFVYHPVGGGGIAKAEDADERRIHVAFDIEKLSIPSVEFSTTSLLGVPLPPPLKIDIVPSKLEGYIDRVSGQVNCCAR